MDEKPFLTEAPFGVSTKRFVKIGFHPKLDKSGAMKRDVLKIGPGSHNPKLPKCIMKSNVTWAQQLETENFSKVLGYKNPRVLREREFQRTLLGPGTNDVNEELFKRKSALVSENVAFGKRARFKHIGWDGVPPPDTYLRNIFKDISTVTHHQFTSVPSFEWSGFGDRFKSKEPKYILPCNLYKINDKKNTDTIAKKMVSLRGPFDLFTGPRDGSTIKNYFAPSSTKVPEVYYIKPSNLDHLLHHHSKARTGLFLRATRFTKKPTLRHMIDDLTLCYRNPGDPGPPHYDLSNLASIKAAPPNLHAFNTSKLNARPPPDWRISPGPGRYNPRMPRCQRVKRMSWVFLTKGDRSVFKVENYRAF